MTLKAKIISVLILMTISYAIGLHNAPAPKTVEVVKDEELKRDTDTHTVKEEIKLPSGETRTTTTTDRTTSTDRSRREESKSIEKAGSKINVSLLAAKDFRDMDKPLLYGISISKEVLGPITAGVFGFSNGVLGLSIGLNF